MAYANQNQGVFIPYRQVIDPRSLNPPVTFIRGPPIGLINPRPQLVPMGFAYNPEFLIRMEKERSRSLLQLMEGEGLVPSPEEEIKRKNAIEKLKQIVMEWIKRVACECGIQKRYISAASATVLTYGSYGLGVHNSESDIDALCVGARFANMGEDFFILLHNMLTGRPEVSEVHCVKDAKVPLMRFKLDGISFDLPYAQLKVMSVPEVSVSSVSLSLSNTVMGRLDDGFDFEWICNEGGFEGGFVMRASPPPKKGGFVYWVFGWYFEKEDLEGGYDRIGGQMT